MVRWQSMQTLTDAELLEAYASRQEDAAFDELVRRHGALVYRACFRMLGDPHEAEDASQAVFVVLARKAGGLRKADLSGWLYRVSHHVAAKAVRTRMRRTRREETHAESDILTSGAGTDEVADPAVLKRVDEALIALPERSREAVILRYLKNHSQEQAARLAGCPVGTLSRRASDGIARLRAILEKQGYATGATALVGALTSEAATTIPETLLPSILATAKSVAVTGTATAGVSASAMALAEGAIKAMFYAQLKTAAIVVATLAVVGGTGLAVMTNQAAGDRRAPALRSANGFERADVDPRLAANLDRIVKVRMRGPRPFSEALERLIRALPPYETLTVRILPDWSPQVQSVRNSELGLDLEDRYNRPLTVETGETTVRRVMDSFARQMEMEWVATGDEVVLWAKYPEATARRLFGAFADPKQPREARRAAAMAIVEAGHPGGLADLLRKLGSDADSVGAQIARSVLSNDRNLVGLNDDGLAAAVRRILTADEMNAIAAAELKRVEAAGKLCRSPMAMDLFGFLRYREAVPVLTRTLKECRDVGGLLSALSKRGSRPQDFRAASARALGRIGGSEAIDALLTALGTEPETKATVISALGLAGDPRSVVSLMGFLATKGVRETFGERISAIEALRALGDTRAEPLILQVLTSADEYSISFLRHGIPAALARLHTDSTAETMQRLMRESRNEEVRQIAAEALWHFRDPQSVPDLLRAIERGSRDDWIVRQRAGWALARIADPISLEPLRRLVLEHGNEGVIGTAAETLAHMHHPDADQVLLEAFRQAKGQDLIWQIGGWACGAQSAETLLEILKNDTDDTRRRFAASAYGRAGSPEAWRTLMQMQAAEKDAGVRIGMLDGLLPAETPEVRDLLLSLAKDDPEPKIRSTAVGLLASHVASDERTAPAILHALKNDASADVRMKAASALRALTAKDPSRWLSERTMISPSGNGSFKPPAPPVLPRPDKPAIEALQERMLDALLEAVRADPSTEARGQIVNEMHSIASDGRPGRRRDKLTAAYLEALKTEKEPEIQVRLVGSFFMRMWDEPGLTDVMLGILQDPARARKVRDQARRNLETLHDRTPQRVRKAVEEYKKQAGSGLASQLK